MARILVVEDEPKIARFIELELIHEGYEVEKAADGRTGVERALGEPFDLILLDVMLPQLNGLEVLRRVRREKDVPVIMLTARDAVMDKVSGLDAGADDYITKPFAIEELLARVRLALRHCAAVSAAPTPGQPAPASAPSASNSPAPAPTRQLAALGVVLDIDRREVHVGGDPVDLTQREFEVLRTLMANKNRVLNREQLAQAALGYDFVGESNIVDVHIRHLRAKIDERFGIKLISTVRGVGYVIREA